MKCSRMVAEQAANLLNRSLASDHLACPGEHSPWLLERRWGNGGKVLPVATLLQGKGQGQLNITDHLKRIIEDIALRVPAFGHIRPAELLVTYTAARNRSRYGLQARVTPMRFRRGSTLKRHGNHWFQVQRYLVDGNEMLYLVTFCLPRFLDQTFEEKLLTIFHELHHISESFNGDIRRFPGRYEIHSRSKEQYDSELIGLREAYLAEHTHAGLLNILHYRSADLRSVFSRIVGVKVPRPKMVPVAACATRA